MDSIYFRDPNGQLLEMACFKFVPPEGHTLADVLSTAHRLRLESGDYNITDKHLADAIAELTEQRVLIT
jgi:glyoxalase family protein